MIEEVKSGRSIPCQIRPVASEDLPSSSDGWKFDRLIEVSHSEVLGLVTLEAGDSVLGLMSIERRAGYIEVKLLENSPRNVGQRKQYRGIAGSLLAFAAKLSFQLGNDGYLMLLGKTRLVEDYVNTYGFKLYRGKLQDGPGNDRGDPSDRRA